ncbi:MAG: hypothetical protein VXZ82_17270 [Planctomycetota bacterium]|nr:hypothetical protein [Planctomycetota bacterium]
MYKLRTFLTAFEAEQTRNRLCEAGIGAWVEGAEAQTAMSYIGSAIGGVAVVISEEDILAAEEILCDDFPPVRPWTCRVCWSDIDEGFDVCWRCGADRSQARQPEPAPPADELAPEDYTVDPGENSFASPDVLASPYAPIATEQLQSRTNEEQRAEEEDMPLVKRALIAAILGPLMLPLIAQLYVIILLARIVPRYPRLNKSERRDVWIAFCACLMHFALLAVFARGFTL